MAVSGTVEIVVSGKVYSNVEKNVLAEHSQYFRALFNDGFNDSDKQRYFLPNFSSSAFEALLDFMTTGKISMKGKHVSATKKILALADFLCIDKFETDIRKDLVSIHSLEPSIAHPLAAHLKVEEEYVESCFQKFQLYRKTNSYGEKGEEVLSYELLTLIASLNKYWHYKRSDFYSDCVDFFWDTRDLITDIWNAALRNPPNLKKCLSLMNSLHLEYFPWNNIKLLLSEANENESTKKCMVSAVKQHFLKLRQEICSRISSIRVCFTNRRNKSCLVGFLEFDLVSWTWVTRKKITTKLNPLYCVMSRDYSNLFVKNGLLIIRNKFPNPKHVNNIYIGEIHRWLDYYWKFLTSCVLGNNIYMFFNPDIDQNYQYFLSTRMWVSQPTLFKINVFSWEFTDCTILPICNAQMVAKGPKLYIVGHSLTSTTNLKVFCYNTVTSEVSEVVNVEDIPDVDFTEMKLGLKNHLLYVFFGRQLQYFTVDTRKDPEQSFNIINPDFYLKQSWNFEIVQLCTTEDGIMLLLDVIHRCHNCDFLGLLLAHLDTETEILKSLGFLPNPRTGYELIMRPLQVQVEKRKKRRSFDKNKKSLDTQMLVEGIEDIQNPPHKGSSWYY